MQKFITIRKVFFSLLQNDEIYFAHFIKNGIEIKWFRIECYLFYDVKR
jgi:hypothetical protein